GRSPAGRGGRCRPGHGCTGPAASAGGSAPKSAIRPHGIRTCGRPLSGNPFQNRPVPRFRVARHTNGGCPPRRVAAAVVRSQVTGSETRVVALALAHVELARAPDL